MIVPMKKVSLIILGDKKKETLKKLRKLGLVHIDISEGSGERLAGLKEQITTLEKSLFSLKKTDNSETDNPLEVAERILALEQQKKVCQSEKLSLVIELERVKKWGDIDPDEINALSQKGIDIYLYDIPKKEYESLGNDVKTLVLKKTKSSVMCVMFENGAEPLNVYRAEIPSLSTSEMKTKISELDSKISEIESEIDYCSRYADSIKKEIKKLEKEVEFEVYATGMTDASDVSVSYFKGYIEAENIDSLKDTASENSWGLVISDPDADDDVPTKLKNNKFVSLIYPLTDFLGTVPGYFEYDISGWFLSFILIFFGIIFGDGGYGLFICAVASVLIVKSLLGKKEIPPAFLLVGLFGLSTVVWGTLTCTWFGLSPEQLPGWLKSLSVPVISNVYADKIWHPFWTSGEIGLTTAQNLQIFCFTLALVQLSVAHIKCAVRNRKSLKILGDIGSIFQLLGIYYVVLSLVVNAKVFSFGLVIGGVPIGTVAMVLVGVGFVMSFVFSNYEGSIVKSILSSLVNIVSVLLGVVNVFSDIVSYIRLWAVGLAGAAISATVNELAGPLLGNFMFMILAIVLLVFGHGLNMILNVLSVIVHGIRLNTLEFSSHLDMSWSGYKFKPFEE